ncbi:uncharacterized protein LOC135804469 [Sycon ciliatum]|uniref:uncharacterized protein LOC135804469 n=1 Tax=Sycon ciliatum TaxID=27933 RepID=UPI0031F5F314
MSSGACRVCGSTSFEEDEGFSFCQECGTQVELVQREEATDDMIMGGGRWASERRSRAGHSDASQMLTLGGASQELVTATPTRTSKRFSARRTAQLEDMQMLRAGHLMRTTGSDDSWDLNALLLYADSHVGDDAVADADNDSRIPTESDTDDSGDETCTAGKSSTSSASAAATTASTSTSSKDGETPQKAAEPKRTWTLVESLQVVLQAQVDALVCAGFPTELEDVVGQLWFLYLRYAGLAFTDNPAEEEAAHAAFQQEGVKRRKRFKKAVRTPKAKRLKRSEPSHTDPTPASPTAASPAQLQPPAEVSGEVQAASVPNESSSDPVTSSQSTLAPPTKSGLRNQGSVTSHRQVRFSEVPQVHSDDDSNHDDSDDSGTMSDYHEQKVQEGLETVEWTEDDDSADAADSSDDEFHQFNPGLYDLPAWSNNKLATKQPRLIHLLAINYLALLSLAEPLLASDMCNMTKEGWFPYFNVDYLLEERMVLWNHQYLLFRTTKAPCPKSLYMLAHDIAKAIDLPLPPIDLGAIATRFLQTLLLPARLAQCFNQFLVLAPLPQHPVVSGQTYQRAWRDTNLDLCCMASLIVVIKLIYGLDDILEWFQAEHSQPIQWNVSTQTPVKPEHRDMIPIWQDWLAMFSERSRGIFSTPSAHQQRLNIRTLMNSDRVVEEQRGQFLMRPPSLHSSKDEYNLRKDICKTHRHTFLKAATGNDRSSYAPLAPQHLNVNADAPVIPERPRKVHAFPLKFPLGPSEDRTRTADDSHLNMSTCLSSGANYVRLKPAAQLHYHQSFGYLLDICAGIIDCNVTTLKRQVFLVESRALRTASADNLHLHFE